MRIKVLNISKSYSKRKRVIPIIQDFSFEFESGKLYVIKGESGKGKTTLLTMLALLQDPDSGEIYFDDKRVNNLSKEEQCEIRSLNIGIVFQDFSLFDNLTVVENVILPKVSRKIKNKKEWEVRAAELLEQFGVGHRNSHRPTELSGGEQQRVGLIRAVLDNPEILICDEPISNLDEINRDKIVQYVDEYCHKQNKIVIVSSHDKAFDQYADIVINL